MRTGSRGLSATGLCRGNSPAETRPAQPDQPRHPLSEGGGDIRLADEPGSVDQGALSRAPRRDLGGETARLGDGPDRHLVKRTRDERFVRNLPDGTPVNHTLAISSLGGATLDNEENYLIKKLFGAGLGMVRIENQARV